MIGTNIDAANIIKAIRQAAEDTLPENQDPEASKYLGADQNTVKIGTRIPLLYGKHQAFGHYLSFNVDAKDISL